MKTSWYKGYSLWLCFAWLFIWPSSTWLESYWLWRKAVGQVTVNGDLLMQFFFFFHFKNLNSCLIWGIWLYCNVMKSAANTVTSWQCTPFQSRLCAYTMLLRCIASGAVGGRDSLISHSDDQSRDEGWMRTLQLSSWLMGLAVRHRG